MLYPKPGYNEPCYLIFQATHCVQLSANTHTNLPQTVSSGYTPTSTTFVFQATSGVQLSSVSGQLLHLQTCHRLSPVAAHLLQLCLFSRLPVVFSCHLYQVNGYTYKPATDCLQWLHTYFNYVFHATSCVQFSAVTGQWLHLQTCHRLSPVAAHLLQENGYTYRPLTDSLQWLHTYFNYLCFHGYQWCSVVSCLPQTVSSDYTPTSTVFVFQATSGFQLSAVSAQWLHLQTVSNGYAPTSATLFSRISVVFSCQLPAKDCLQWLHTYFNCLQWLHTYFNCLCFPGYQWCSVVICIRSMVTPTNLPQTVSSGCTPTSTMFSMLTSCVQFSAVSGQWLHLQTCHRLSPVAAHLLQLFFPCYQLCSIVSCIRTMVIPTDLSQTVSSGYTPTSTIFVFQDNQWCSVVSCLPQTVSSDYTPTSTVFVFQATSGVQLSAVSG